MTHSFEINGEAKRKLAEFRLEYFDMSVKDRNRVLEKVIDIAHKKVVEDED